MWLRLELQALSRALGEDDSGARRCATDALLFRALRHRLHPGSDSLEASLERNEGLAEYTGMRFAMRVTGEGAERAAKATVRFEKRKSYVRSLGYGTGPALGLLLDRFAPGWRARVDAIPSLAGELAARLGFTPGAALEKQARARAAEYGYATVVAEEDQRAAERAERTADYRRRLVDGPVLVLRQKGVGTTFDPNTVVGFGDAGTVYPTGVFQAVWGRLEVTQGGALIASDLSLLRVPAPDRAPGRRSGKIEGPGWTLELAPGWIVEVGPRAGDFAVKAE